MNQSKGWDSLYVLASFFSRPSCQCSCHSHRQIEEFAENCSHIERYVSWTEMVPPPKNMWAPGTLSFDPQGASLLEFLLEEVHRRWLPGVHLHARWQLGDPLRLAPSPASHCTMKAINKIFGRKMHIIIPIELMTLRIKSLPTLFTWVYVEATISRKRYLGQVLQEAPNWKSLRSSLWNKSDPLDEWQSSLPLQCGEIEASSLHLIH